MMLGKHIFKDIASQDKELEYLGSHKEILKEENGTIET